MSTRVAGDLYIKKLRQAAKVQKFLRQLKIKPEELVSMEQVHGSEVAIVEDAHKSSEVILPVDGLVTQCSGLFLRVNVADCVPVFLYDPVKQIIGVVHAGWRGTLANIISGALLKFKKLGSLDQNILVAIGPHISSCCYSVPYDRAIEFEDVFNLNFANEFQWVYELNNQWFVDLGLVNRLQLIKEGVLPENIDAPVACTSCQNDRYFSFRKDSKETFGEMLGVIGIRTV